MRAALAIGLSCAACCGIGDLFGERPPDPAEIPPAPASPLGPDAFVNLDRPVPQLDAALFDSAAPHARGPLVRGVLICRVTVRAGPDPNNSLEGDPDPILTLAVRGGTPRTSPVHDDMIFTASFPVARLNAGDALVFQLLDEDILFHDLMAQGEGTFGSAPFRVPLQASEAECRTLEGEAVSVPADAAIRELAAAIDAMPDPTPSLAVRDFGYPQGAAHLVMDAAKRVLAWVSTSDPAYRAQIERAAAYDGRWHTRLAAAIGAARAPASATLEDGSRIRSARRSCGEDAHRLGAQIGLGSTPLDRCAVTITLESEATSVPVLEVESIDERGGVAPTSLVARRYDGGAWVTHRDPLTVDPGRPVELVYTTRWLERSALLRIITPTEIKLVAMR
jgi:hypothetical protein